MLVFELVALVPSFTVMLILGMTAAIGRHAPNLAGGCWNRPYIGWGDPIEGQAPIGPTKSPCRRRGLLLGVLSDWFQLGPADDLGEFF